MFSLDQYNALKDGAGLLDRSSRGRLSLTGVDRRAYLQGLLTNDIAALGPGTGCYTAYLTAQGRMVADMRLLETGDELLADMIGAVTTTVRDRWEQFVFSEDVQIAEVSMDTAQLGVYGPQAAGALEAALGLNGLEALPLHGNRRIDALGSKAVVLRSDDIGLDGFDVITPVERKGEVTARLRASGVIDVGHDTAEVCRIEAGRPLFCVDMDEQTIPLEAGIEDRAFSLTKGCYVGQEIIIRVLHRGHGRVARRLIGLTFDAGAPVPARGDRLRAGDREVGTITSAAMSPALGRPIALGMLHRDFTEPGVVVHANDAPATVTRLPFRPKPEVRSPKP